MPQEMRIDGAVRDGQPQPGNEQVFELFPDLCGVGFFGFHGPIQSGERGDTALALERFGRLCNAEGAIQKRRKSPGRMPAVREGHDVPAAARNLRYRAPTKEKAPTWSGRSTLGEEFYQTRNRLL